MIKVSFNFFISLFKSLQIQKRNEILLNERVLAKEKECNRLKTELEQAHSCVLTLKNHLDTNVSKIFEAYE